MERTAEYPFTSPKPMLNTLKWHIVLALLKPLLKIGF